MHNIQIPGLAALLPAQISCRTGESPLWDARRACWWWCDIHGRAIWQLDAAGHARHWPLDVEPACIVLSADSDLVCCAGQQIGTLALNDHAPGFTPMAHVAHAHDDMRFNDGRCDRQGRLWVSSLRKQGTAGSESSAAGCWYRFTRNSPPRLQEGRFHVPNGAAFSPDGRRFYRSDSHRAVRTIWLWDYAPDTGEASHRRVFAEFTQADGRPDGAAVDCDGGYWICCQDAGCVRRYTPDGRLDQVIHTPMRHPTMCAFGDADLKTLLVTSLRRNPGDTADPHGGRLLMFRPGAQGISETPLA